MHKLIPLALVCIALSACDQDKEKDAKTPEAEKPTITETAKKAVESGKEAVTATKEAVKDTAEKAVESSKEAVTATKEVVKETAEKTVEAGKEVAQDAANMANKAVDKTKDAVAAAKSGFDKQAALKEAQGITKAFVGSLKAELQKAMAEGGPVNALSVCNTKAMEITAKASEEHGAMVSRVSLKNRNPKNVPDAWQKSVLTNFDSLAAMGEDVMKMGYAEVIENNGKKQFHFMKALPTAKLCLSCHGKTLAPELQAKLNELYPDDKATGYEEGQVRGAVVVIKDIGITF